MKPKIKDYTAIILLLLSFASINAQSQPTQRQALTAREIAQKTLPAVVIVVVKDSSGKVTSYGSGFFVRGDVVATNYHVISKTTNASHLFIRFPRSKLEFGVIKLFSVHVKDDLALLDVGDFSRAVSPLDLGESSKMAIGDVVYAAGNPEGLSGTFSQGIVSGRRQIGEAWYIQISAPISHGSSGGPVLNEFGQVVGVAAAGLDEGQNLNFAVPSSSLRALMSQSVDSPDPRQRALSETIAERVLSGGYVGKEGEAASERIRVSEADLYFDEGLVLAGDGKYEEAIQKFALCIRRAPAYSEAYYQIGLCLLLLDRFPAAISALKSAVRINPNHADAHQMLGFTYLSEDDKAAALDEYAILKKLNAKLAKELFDKIYP